jgi:hypothetical protein
MASPNEQRAPAGSQQAIDQFVLEYHREIAKRLLAAPEVVLAKARGNLERWMSAYGSGSPDAGCFEEWWRLLETRTAAELAALITDDSDEGQRLRSSTPFTGLLSPEERKELRARYEENSAS